MDQKPEQSLVGVKKIAQTKSEKIDKDYKDYNSYKESGGIIGESDYKNALSRAEVFDMSNKKDPQIEAAMSQGRNMAKFANISPQKDKLDQIILLYALLRSEMQTGNVIKNHYKMNDQKLFEEVLKIFGGIDSL